MSNIYFSNKLNIKKIKAESPINAEIHHFESVDSTNSWLQIKGQCGDICISDTQTAGRGRRGNQWVSPDTGNVYFSLMWCFNNPKMPQHFSLLGLVVGIAVAEALEALGLTGHGVKWPNDIFWQQKKLGGILIERVNQSNKVIIGIGLNVNMPEQEASKIDQNISSLSQALNTNADKSKQVSRDQLLIAMIQYLHKHLSQFESLSIESFMADWEKWDILKDQNVSFMHQNKEIFGTVTSLDKHGQIGILNEMAELNFYSSAEIKLRKPS
ncbi:MAG TPA: biotin--[acetyl-CoA-carboxylase] ligase [Leucothrix sp.]|nr:biotin--[acetyl-CoA-carboxylase] ligase [Leucothrix sp.]